MIVAEEYREVNDRPANADEENRRLLKLYVERREAKKANIKPPAGGPIILVNGDVTVEFRPVADKDDVFVITKGRAYVAHRMTRRAARQVWRNLKKKGFVRW